MEILLPQLGLFFWALILFVLLFILLSKFAWKPIMQSIKDREKTIQDSLDEAKNAREEMANLQADNERLLAEARAERDALLNEARTMKDKIISEAKTSAESEAARIVKQAREQINSEKMAVMIEIKNQVGLLSLEVAETVLRKELSDSGAQQQLVEKLVSEMNLN
ncbi:UNVERIFIED_CONTAM: hypothetical protein GTU68_061100 [Idotea baltica]|nr:hypothetical protein [Idotea baltica]